MTIIIGVTMMVAGIGVVFSARIFPKQRDVVERCGFYIFLAGLGIWAITFAI
jgi:hypothetical protein